MKRPLFQAWKKLITPRRKDHLAVYMLNLNVASFAVATFEGKFWGFIPFFVFLIGFFVLTREKGVQP